MKGWLLRLLKGALIGTGFILPGVSGGALAAVFGLYERMIGFIANLTKDFVENLLFFIPVGLGALGGMVVLSRPLSFFLEHYETQVLWFFIGAILGTFPALWRDAGKKGRGFRHLVLLLVALAAGFAFLFSAERLLTGGLPRGFLTWLLAGALIAVGALVPGLSPSNFLVYFGLYKPMVEAFKTLDLAVLAPILLGAAACMLLLSRAINALLGRAYTGTFHCILGIVLASTLMIVPTGYNYLQPATFFCVAAAVAGGALAYWMSKLEG